MIADIAWAFENIFKFWQIPCAILADVFAIKVHCGQIGAAQKISLYLFLNTTSLPVNWIDQVNNHGNGSFRKMYNWHE